MSEWPKPGDVVAVRDEFLGALSVLGWPSTSTAGIVTPDRIAPWRSAEEVRAAEAVIEEVRDAMEWWGTGARERLILKLAAYDRAREEAHDVG